MSSVQEVLRRELSFLTKCADEEELPAALDAYKQWEMMGSLLVSEAKRRRRECAISRLTSRLSTMMRR